MDNRVGQVSMEIILLVGFLFLVFVIFLGFVNQRLTIEHDEQESLMLRDVSLQIQNEIRLAYNAKEGYSRDFNVPEKLEGRIDYNIQVIQNSLLTNTSKYQYVLDIPTITGAVIKGENNIKKINQSIIIN